MDMDTLNARTAPSVVDCRDVTLRVVPLFSLCNKLPLTGIRIPEFPRNKQTLSARPDETKLFFFFPFL